MHTCFILKAEKHIGAEKSRMSSDIRHCLAYK